MTLVVLEVRRKDDIKKWEEEIEKLLTNAVSSIGLHE